MKTVITVLLIVLFLGGCSIKLPEHKPAYTPGELAMISDCRAWVQEIEGNKNEQMSTVPTNQKAFVLMHSDTMAMIKATFGKQTDVCRPGDDYAKAYVAYAAGQKEISITALKQAGASVRAIAYVVGAVEISKQFGGNDSSQETTTTTTTETSETFAPVE
jgi:hypothetical protein